MSDWTNPWNSTPNADCEQDQQEPQSPQPPEPEVGLYDIVEAFTAMRQQWRTNAKENRDLALAVQSSADGIASAEQRLGELLERQLRIAESLANIEAQLPWVKCVAEMDYLIRRAVSSLEHVWESGGANSRVHGSSQALQQVAIKELLEDSINQQLKSLAWWRRTICRPFAVALRNTVSSVFSVAEAKPSSTNSELAGMHLLLSRLQRMLNEHGIERRDTLGQPFDGQWMLAVDAVPWAEVSDPRFSEFGAKGHGHSIVVHEYSPAYSWQGKLVKIAEVRVAR